MMHPMTPLLLFAAMFAGATLLGLLALIPAGIARARGFDAELWWAFGFCFWPVAMVWVLLPERWTLNNESRPALNAAR